MGRTLPSSYIEAPRELGLNCENSSLFIITDNMVNIKAIGYRTQCNRNWSLAAHCSKAKKDKVGGKESLPYLGCQQSGAGGMAPVLGLTPLSPTFRGKSFYRLREGATCRNNTVSSDQCHLDLVTD